MPFFSSILQDGAYGKDLDGKDEQGNIRPYQLGHWFIAIDTEHFLGEALCRKKTGDIIRAVRASKKAPGQDRIYTAGEKEYEAYNYRMKYGCPVPKSLQNVIDELSDRYSLTDSWPWR